MSTLRSVPRRALNRLKLAVNQRLWRKTSLPESETLHRLVERPFSKTRAAVPHPKIQAVYDDSNERVLHKEWAFASDGDLRIEPHSGWVMTPDRKLVREFIVYDHPSVYPQWPALTTKKQHFDEVIQFDHHWGVTYFHFYSDVLHKLHLIDRFPERLGKLPLVVSRKTFDSKWFSFFRHFPWIRDRNWFVQEPRTMVHARRVWALQPMPYSTPYWTETRRVVEQYRKPMDPKRRIFVNRAATTGRYVKNVSELKPVLERHGFEVVELEKATMEQQVALFSSAAVVVTMHGAALTNLIYSSPQVRVLEFVPDEEISCHYYWVSQTMGVAHYDAVLGSPLEYDVVRYPRGRFSVDPQQLEKQLQRLFAAEDHSWLKAR